MEAESEKKVESENETDRYARKDVQGGFIYNKSEIEYYKQTQAIDVIQNLMLGDYNKKGGYVLDKGIIDELVKMKKTYQYSFGSTTFCQSCSKVGEYGKIDFAIKIRNGVPQKGYVTATLQVLETIDRANGYYQNTNSATIATFSAIESGSFVVDMLKNFNVSSKAEEGLISAENKEEDVSLVIARKNLEGLIKKSSSKMVDDENKKLYEKRIKLLEKSDVGKKILDEFKAESYKINGWFVKEDMPGYYRYLNQILDGLIEVHSAEVLQDVKFKASWNKLNQDMAMFMNNMLLSLNQSLFSKAQSAKMNEIVVELQKQAQATGQQVIQPKAQEQKQQEQEKQQEQSKQTVKEKSGELSKPAEQKPQERPGRGQPTSGDGPKEKLPSIDYASSIANEVLNEANDNVLNTMH